MREMASDPHARTGMLGLFLYVHDKMLQMQQQHHAHKQQRRYEHLAAEIGFFSSGIPNKVELYGEYAARQIGLSRGSAIAKRLAEAAMAYLQGDKSASDLSLEGILLFLSRACSSQNLDDEEMLLLNRELVKELDVCMISYFAFHWHYAAHLLDQVRDGQRKLKHIVIAATRKHRFDKIMTTFKTKRAFSTLLETLKAMQLHRRDSSIPEEGHVVVPANSSVRSPVLLVIGGGMGAGKSTVVKEILGGSFWSAAVQDAVVVEADAFKETDVVYRTISSLKHGSGGDIAFASELVHQSSTQAASSLLVSALNEGRDVIFDGTMSWEPFVLQTIAMARDVHNRRYRLGPGYVQAEDGSVTEEYWVPTEEENDTVHNKTTLSRKPYRIELVAVTCDPLLAVIRGIRRAIITKRGVPIKGQLRSHKLFAASLEKYCELVDNARIYSTSKLGEPAELIGWKDSLSGCNRLLIVPEAFQSVKEVARINENADSVLELFEDGHACGVWKDLVLAPERGRRQAYLKEMLTKSAVAGLDHSSTESSLYSTSSPDSSVHDDSSSFDASDSGSSHRKSRLDLEERMERLVKCSQRSNPKN